MNMNLVPHEINLLVSSNPAAGAINRSADGSSFEVQFDEGMKIPSDALNITLTVEESTIWWVVPNILTGVNDKLYITVPREIDDVLTAYVVTLQQGLYDRANINQAVLRELTNQGAKITPNQTISINPDDAIQKIDIRLNYLGSSIDFTQPDTFRDILGFNSQILGPTIVAPQSFIADNTAAFNTINYFLIKSDLISKGIRFNNEYNQTIAQVLIDVAPGSQIVSKPFNPARSVANELAGSTRTNLRMYLTDDVGNPVNTAGESWTARIVIKYLLPHILENSKRIRR